MSLQGRPIWYELGSRAFDASEAFYGAVLDWQFDRVPMEGFDYGLAMKEGAMIAGLMSPEAEATEAWRVYFAVEDCDASTARAKILGATVLRAPEYIPGTGRYALLLDPQGTDFGLLAPEGGDAGQAFDPCRVGHPHWHELHSSEPEAGFAFYADLLGWDATTAMDMGADGNYQLFAHDGADIGAAMGLLGEAGRRPYWLPYFGSADILESARRVTAAGGEVIYGPAEVPGGVFILHAKDSRGVSFALVGPKP